MTALLHRNYILEKTDTMDTFGGFNSKVVIALLLAWIMTALVLVKGVKMIGKISGFTATVPYIIIAILFVRSIMLDGARIGLDYYLLKPDISTIWNPSVRIIGGIARERLSVADLARGRHARLLQFGYRLWRNLVPVELQSTPPQLLQRCPYHHRSRRLHERVRRHSGVQRARIHVEAVGRADRYRRAERHWACIHRLPRR